MDKQYAEPVEVRTLILVAPVPGSLSQGELTPKPQENTPSPEFSGPSSLPNVTHPSAYSIGPMLNPDKLIPMQVQLTSGQRLSCGIPSTIPLTILMHPMFREGCEWGYNETYPEEQAYTLPTMLNELFQFLSELRDVDDPEFCPWTIGFSLGTLARLSEEDCLLALTGLAHLCYLLSFLSPGSWGYPFSRLGWAYEFHLTAMWDYRARIRMFCEQGKSFVEAQRLALAGNEQ